MFAFFNCWPLANINIIVLETRSGHEMELKTPSLKELLQSRPTGGGRRVGGGRTSAGAVKPTGLCLSESRQIRYVLLWHWGKCSFPLFFPQ